MGEEVGGSGEVHSGRCNGRKEARGEVDRCALPDTHTGDCQDENGTYLGMPEVLRRKA